MNRCLFVPLTRTATRWALGATLALAHLHASAQSENLGDAPAAVRSFPAQALRASMVVTGAPNVLIDGKPERLSPGARIFGANRMLVLSATLTGQKLLVNLVRNPQGQVHEVWILNEAEARMPQALATPFPYSP